MSKEEILEALKAMGSGAIEGAIAKLETMNKAGFGAADLFLVVLRLTQKVTEGTLK